MLLCFSQESAGQQAPHPREIFKQKERAMSTTSLSSSQPGETSSGPGNKTGWTEGKPRVHARASRACFKGRQKNEESHQNPGDTARNPGVFTCVSRDPTSDTLGRSVECRCYS